MMEGSLCDRYGHEGFEEQVFSNQLNPLALQYVSDH